MTKRIFIYAFLFVIGQIAFAQKGISDSEFLILDINKTLLYTGDNLMYKVFCRNGSNKAPSSISKIAYVELVNSEGVSVKKQKIRLDNGIGYGDFFLDEALNSGSYKLLTYTYWSLNNVEERFAQTDFVLINPFKTGHLKLNNGYFSAKEASGDESTNLPLKGLNNSYSTREKVSFSFNSANKGNISISVRKKDASTIAGKQVLDKVKVVNPVDISAPGVYLPELRGELIIGKLTDTSGREALNNQSVALSIAGKDNILKITRTNSEGVFFFNLLEDYESETAIVQIIGNNKGDFEIELNNFGLRPNDYKSLKFPTFKLDKVLQKEIEQRSIWSQIENAYNDAHQDLIVPKPKGLPFYGNQLDVYDLDDYNRFSTMEEVFVELIDLVRILKDDNKNRIFVIKGRDTEFNKEILPLVFVDGILVQDYEKLVEYKAKKIKKISVMRDVYYYGTHLSRGILAFETINGDYHDDVNANYLKAVDLFSIQPEKKYFHKDYSNKKRTENSRVPDYRTQLYWNPDYDLSQGKHIEFFTADIKGVYEIVVKGLTDDGHAISGYSTFVIE